MSTAEAVHPVWGEAWTGEGPEGSRLLPRADLRPGITVAIPAIPPRVRMLSRAVGSTLRQTRPADAIAICFDHERLGAPANRDRALGMVETEWTAFLDDDDELGIYHLEKLEREQQRTGADLVFPWFHVIGENSPFPQHEGLEWNIGPDNLDDFRMFPITVLVRTNLLLEIGGFSPRARTGTDRPNTNEDLAAWMELLKRGARFTHLPERTWYWHHHGANTSGRPERW